MRRSTAAGEAVTFTSHNSRALPFGEISSIRAILIAGSLSARLAQAPPRQLRPGPARLLRRDLLRVQERLSPHARGRAASNGCAARAVAVARRAQFAAPLCVFHFSC